MSHPSLWSLMLGVQLVVLNIGCAHSSDQALAVKRSPPARSLGPSGALVQTTEKILLMPRSRLDLTLKNGDEMIGYYLGKKVAKVATRQSVLVKDGVAFTAPQRATGLSISVETTQGERRVLVSDIARLTFHKPRSVKKYVAVGGLITAASATLLMGTAALLASTLGGADGAAPSSGADRSSLSGFELTLVWGTICAVGFVPGAAIGSALSRLPGPVTEVELDRNWSLE